MTQEELQMQQQAEQQTGSQGGVTAGGFAKGAAMFAAYGYAYNQLDNITTGMMNSAMAGSQSQIRLPFIKGFGEGKEITGRWGFTTNTFASMNKKGVTQSQVFQMLSRGDKNSLEMLKAAGVDDEIIGAFSKGKVTGAAKRVLDLNGRNAVNLGLAEQRGQTGIMDDILEKVAKKKGVETSVLKANMAKAQKALKASQLQPDTKGGVGLVINSAVGSKSKVGALALRGLGTWLGVWYNPYMQMAIKPSIGAATTAITNGMGVKRKDNFTMGAIESQHADVSAENIQSRQIGMQKAYQDQNFTAGLISAGREADRYLQGLYSPQGGNQQPNQYRKRFR